MSNAEDAAGRADLLLLATILVWGVNFPVLKVALAAFHPTVVNALRFTVSALVLGGIYLARNRASPASLLGPLRAGGWRVVGLGLLGYFLFPLVFLYGVDATTAGNAALLMASAPLWTALVSRAVGLERLGPRGWVGLLVALAGTALVVLGGPRATTLGSAALVGNVLVLVAAALWGVFTVFSRPVLDDVSPMELALFALAVALPPLYAVAWPHVGAAVFAVEPVVWGAIAFSGAFGTGLAFVWWNTSVKAVGPSTAGVYANAVPLVALAVGAVALGESVGAVQVVGAVLVIGGTLVVRRARVIRRLPPVTS